MYALQKVIVLTAPEAEWSRWHPVAPWPRPSISVWVGSALARTQSSQPWHWQRFSLQSHRGCSCCPRPRQSITAAAECIVSVDSGSREKMYCPRTRLLPEHFLNCPGRHLLKEKVNYGFGKTISACRPWITLMICVKSMMFISFQKSWITAFPLLK